MQDLYLFLDMEPSTCPESISEPPGLVFSSWPWAAGNIRFVLELVSKKPTSRKPSGIKPKSNKLLQVILYLSAFPKEFRTINFFLMVLSISLLQPSSDLRNLNKNIFFMLSLEGFILKRLCSRQVPHVASHPGSLYPGFSDLSWTWGIRAESLGESADRRWGNRPGRASPPALKEAE